MTKLEREAKRVSTLKKCYSIIPNLNNIIIKAEPYIKAYNKALKNYWENGKDKDIFTSELIKSEVMTSAYRGYDWNYDLTQLDKNYRQLLKI